VGVGGGKLSPEETRNPHFKCVGEKAPGRRKSWKRKDSIGEKNGEGRLQKSNQEATLRKGGGQRDFRGTVGRKKSKEGKKSGEENKLARGECFPTGHGGVKKVKRLVEKGGKNQKKVKQEREQGVVIGGKANKSVVKRRPDLRRRKRIQLNGKKTQTVDWGEKKRENSARGGGEITARSKDQSPAERLRKLTKNNFVQKKTGQGGWEKKERKNAPGKMAHNQNNWEIGTRKSPTN